MLMLNIILARSTGIAFTQALRRMIRVHHRITPRITPKCREALDKSKVSCPRTRGSAPGRAQSGSIGLPI